MGEKTQQTRRLIARAHTANDSKAESFVSQRNDEVNLRKRKQSAPHNQRIAQPKGAPPIV